MVQPENRIERSHRNTAHVTSTPELQVVSSWTAEHESPNPILRSISYVNLVIRDVFLRTWTLL